MPETSLAEDQARRGAREALNQRTPMQRVRDVAGIVTGAGNVLSERVNRIKRSVQP